ncbi:hypothetical protein HK096_007418, partial [Nowakowskiella sp. JEL0078]
DDITAREELEVLNHHLILIDQISKLTDPNTFEYVPKNFFQQFDLSFGSEVEELAEICVDMALQGVPPLLINATSKLLLSAINSQPSTPRSSTTSPQILRRLDIRSIYIEAIKTAFSKGIVAVDNILAAVVGAARVETEWGSDEILDDEVAELEKVLKKWLLDFILTDGGVDVREDVQLASLELFQKYFVEDIEELGKLMAYKLTSTVKSFWDVEIDTTIIQNDVDEQIELIGQLLSLSETIEQALALRVILLEWDPKLKNDDFRQCWADFMVWMARNEQYGLLIVTRIMFNDSSPLGIGAEIQLLDTLREQNLTEYWKHGLLSANPQTIETILANLISSSSTSTGDWILHIIIASKGYTPCIPTTSPMWDSLITTLITLAKSSPPHPSHNISLIDFVTTTRKGGYELQQRVVADVVSVGRLGVAAALVFQFGGLDKELAAGITTRFVMLRKFLETDQGGDSNYHAEIGSVLTVAGLVGWVEGLSDNRKNHALENLNWYLALVLFQVVHVTQYGKLWRKEKLAVIVAVPF